VSGFDGPFLSIENVTGMGLEGAVKLDPAKMPKAPDEVPAPEKAYELK
jgi:hypothetical protein